MQPTVTHYACEYAPSFGVIAATAGDLQVLEMITSGICRFETTISIDCPPTTLYERWSDPGSWPTFAESLTTSLQRTQAMSEDSQLASSFEPLTVNRIPGELLAWRM